MQRTASDHPAWPTAETLEQRTFASVSQSLTGQTTSPTRTLLKVDAGTMGQTITCTVIICNSGLPAGTVGLFPQNKPFQPVSGGTIASPLPGFAKAYEDVYEIPAGVLSSQAFGPGLHILRATFGGIKGATLSSTAVAAFRIKRPQFSKLANGVGVQTLSAGSGPALQAGQTATVQYNAYLAASYRLFDSTESQTPDTFSFSVDGSPEQVIPGLDAGVLGMQAGETRAISIPYALGYGVKGIHGKVPPRSNLVYLVTLVSIT